MNQFVIAHLSVCPDCKGPLDIWYAAFDALRWRSAIFFCRQMLLFPAEDLGNGTTCTSVFELVNTLFSLQHASCRRRKGLRYVE